MSTNMDIQKSTDIFKKYWFPSGTMRIVHVSRAAIIANTRDNKNFPTILVIDSGVKYAFHSVILRGPSRLRFQNVLSQIEANVILETEDGIEAFIDTTGDIPNKDLYVTEYKEKKIKLLHLPIDLIKRCKRRFGYLIYGRPVSWCQEKM